MKSIILSIFLLFIVMNMKAQGDAFETIDGKVIIHPVYHATMVIEWDGNVIFVDPYGGAERFKAYGSPDLVLITDIHPDHLDPETLSGINISKAKLIAPPAVIEQLGDLKFGEVIEVSNGEIAKWKGRKIQGVPMYNLPETDDAFHVKGRGNGYILNIADKRFYISGDTENIPEMKSLSNIDVAFVCMNLPYTMSVEDAVDGVLAFKPSVVYPFHYRNKNGRLSDVEKFKSLVNKANPNIEVRIRDWYPE